MTIRDGWDLDRALAELRLTWADAYGFAGVIVDELSAQINAVRDLHTPVRPCRVCGQPYPCPTARRSSDPWNTSGHEASEARCRECGQRAPCATRRALDDI